MNPEQPSAPVTLATIAAHLGVSRSTVSNAYNHPDQLSPRLRDRILTTAASLGYNGPDPVARRLRKGRSGAIGILFSEPLQRAFADPASVLFLEGVAAAGEKADSGMLLIPADPTMEYAQVVDDAMVDGFLLYSIPPGHPFVEAAMRRRLPVVCVDQTRVGGSSWVGIDDRSAARIGAEHILELGHRELGLLVYGLGPGGFVSGGDSPCVSWLRMDGWRDACEATGLQWNSVTMSECETNTLEEATAAARTLLQRPNPPTAVMCSSDTLALGALAAAYELGIQVPAQLSVIGFNDVPEAANANLTTIRQPLKEKGEQAAAFLFGHELQPGTRITLDAELVRRKTTAVAPAPPSNS